MSLHDGHLYIEWREVALGQMHLYLVYRPDHSPGDYSQWQTISGWAQSVIPPHGQLRAFTGLLDDTNDAYPLSEQSAPESYATQHRGAREIGEGISLANWEAMKGFASAIGGPASVNGFNTGQYNYEAVSAQTVNLSPTLNSNSFVASVLAHAGYTLHNHMPTGNGNAPGELHILGDTGPNKFKPADTGTTYAPGVVEDGHDVLDGRNVNLSGGQGNDSLIGNDVANGLFGGMGDDTLYGAGGGRQSGLRSRARSGWGPAPCPAQGELSWSPDRQGAHPH